MSREDPRTPAEWEAYEAKVAQESANEKSERLQKILVPGPEVKPADVAMKSDFLDRPNLKIREYKPVSPGGVALPGSPCAWSEAFDAPTCGHVAHFMIVDPATGAEAVMCRDHTLRAARERKAKAVDAAARFRAERAQRKLENWRKREGHDKG